MTDYAEPAAPAEVCQRIHDDFMGAVQRLRRDADLILARADELERAAWAVDAERRNYAKWQPATDLDPAGPPIGASE